MSTRLAIERMVASASSPGDLPVGLPDYVLLKVHPRGFANEFVVYICIPAYKADADWLAYMEKKVAEKEPGDPFNAYRIETSSDFIWCDTHPAHSDCPGHD